MPRPLGVALALLVLAYAVVVPVRALVSHAPTPPAQRREHTTNAKHCVHVAPV